MGSHVLGENGRSQRIQAKTGVRKHATNSRNSEPVDGSLSKLPDKEQKELAQQLGDILKEHRERGISTGAGQVPATRSVTSHTF